MKKNIVYMLVCMLVFTSVVETIASSKVSAQSVCKGSEGKDFTHVVLGEYGTATWCHFCQYAHAALKNIYMSGDYPFYYVSFVHDKNTPVCNPRLYDEFNLYGFPTVFFDGGYRVDVGGDTGSETAFRSSIVSCGSRTVYDVDIHLEATWLGGTEMEINVSVDNNEASTYNGTVRVYITEIISSMNWKDTAGKLYTFPLLDYAFNQDGTGINISIPAHGTWSDSTTWDGSAHGYPNITEDNMMVMAAVFNDDWHQGYSFPPSEYPFDAYYVDDAVGVRLGTNRQPTLSSIRGPLIGDIRKEYNYTFSAVDLDWFNNLYYYIDWGDGTMDEWVGPYHSEQKVIQGHTWLRKGNYTIKAKVKDDSGAESDWVTLTVSMPVDKVFNFHYSLLEWLCNRFPHLFPVVRHVFGL